MSSSIPTKRTSGSPPTSPSKRSCSGAAAVLTNPELVAVITDYSANCLELCPELYEVLDMDDIGSGTFEEQEQALMRLNGRYVANGFVDANLNPDDDVDAEELVERAKASVTDFKALHRALQVRQKLAEFADLIKDEHERPAAGIEQYDFCKAGPIIFQPTFLVDPTSGTWGREDLIKIFQNDELAIQDGRGVPNGLGWHYWNVLSSNDHCAYCAAAEGIDPDNEALRDDSGGYGDGEPKVSDAWKSFMEEKGLDSRAFLSWRSYAYERLVSEKDEHVEFCTRVVRPLKAYLESNLADVKLVTIDYRDDCDQIASTSFVGGLTTDGYLVGIYFCFIDVL
ncbi:hypothetical protein ACHHYP_01694 [Achlya hypogyna]|uniref:Uncharacterized protein n=1 Tax=Achlya hypogyna TaxID=1202772 RepID=A0A1V9Z7Z3_ACHHY|nr:hypothetical protein ACHHYP_01694 [Achlya hypogyna]